MIVDIFVVLLIALKALGVIDISWTITIIISLSLLAVSIQMYLNKKALLNAILNSASVIDDQLASFEVRLNAKQDREPIDYD